MKSDYREELKELSTNVTKFCIQCGNCGGVCPIGRIHTEITPRKSLCRLAVDESRKLETDKEELWLCLTCYACDEICPQGIEVVDTLLKVRNHLCKNKETPDNIKEMLKSFKKTGAAAPYKREGYEVDVKDLQRITSL